MELDEIRKKLDEIDNSLIELFKSRMALSLEVAKYKEENNIPVLDTQREEKILESVALRAGENLGDYAKNLYSAIFRESRRYQENYLKDKAEYGLLGRNISHSFSPLIHRELGKYRYRLFDIPKEELEEFLYRREFKGLNVTIPYKKAVIPYCTALTSRAEKIGAVNTIKALPNGLMGDNTDCLGFSYLARSENISFKNKKVLILGTGGTSLTVEYVLHEEGVREVIKISRSGENNYENIEKHSDADILINTTPVGMYPNNGECLVDLSIFKKLSYVVDVIYNPLKTELLQRAEELKIPCCNGFAMLLAQAIYSAEIFCGEEIEKSQIEKIQKKLLKDRTNIVLIGMPSAGKTTLAALLAKKMGREFLDTDSFIEQSAGKGIPQIFKDDGEKEFRILETEAIRTCSKKNGVVIAVGGGAVLNPENIRALKANGKICYIKREIDMLSTDYRPLSKNRESLVEMFRIREPLYMAAKDFSVENKSDINFAADDILEEFYANFGD